MQVLYKIQEKLAQINDTVYNYRKEPNNEISCKKTIEPKKSRPRTVGEPMLSKIEIQLANGTYDEFYGKYKKKQQWTNACATMISLEDCQNSYCHQVFRYSNNNIQIHTSS